tara:strand:+ start:35881 stop:36258 length:378 start_codon:yes stop_codon:yes gene_type:complete
MANNTILKRGQKQTVEVTVPDDNDNVQNFTSGFTASMVLRKSAGKIDRSFSGDQVDSLTSASGRITFHYVDANTKPNVKLLWNTAQATALPNTDVTVGGDLKIFNSSNECVESVRLEFDIKHEVT